MTATLAALLGCMPPVAVASCTGDLQGTDGALGAEIGRDTRRAIVHLGELLAQPAQARDGGFTPAHLYAMQSDAYFLSGDTAAAIKAARQGIDALREADPQPLRRRLRLQFIFMQEDLGHLNQALHDYEAEAATVPEDAPEMACVLTDRGYLRFRVGHMADAASDLLKAAELARAQGSDLYRTDANVRLVPLYSRNGFYGEARALVDEALAFYEKLGDPVRIMDARYALGDLLRDQGRLEESQVVFEKTLAMATALGSRSDESTLQERLCRVDAMMSRQAEARGVCARSYATAVAMHDPENAKRALGSLARIELAAGDPRKASELVDRALESDDVDLPQRALAQLHLLRAQVRTQTGDPAGALADMKAYTDWLGEDRVARSAAQVGMIRLRFDRALREQELGRLRAEATAARLTASERTLTLNVVVFCAALLTSAVLGVVWIRRRRREAVRLVQAAEERLAAMGQVTGGIAHDFNNQLTVMQHAVWMLLQRPDLAANREVRDLLRGIQQSSRDCAHITSQMMSYARQQNLQPEAVALGGWLRQHLPLFQGMAGSAMTMQLEVADPGPVAWVDPKLLAAALLNMVANARDATAGPGLIIIRASPEAPSSVLIEVVDRGCGMTPEVQARATEPFYTTKEIGHGSGLGLSMVQGFATQSGGSLRLSSTPGQGTTVSLRLPAPGGHDGRSHHGAAR